MIYLRHYQNGFKQNLIVDLSTEMCATEFGFGEYRSVQNFASSSNLNIDVRFSGSHGDEFQY
jgi:hypothetical protein